MMAMATKKLWNANGQSVEVPESWPEFPEYRKQFPLDAPAATAQKPEATEQKPEPPAPPAPAAAKSENPDAATKVSKAKPQ
jgi:hypothetical protein